MGECKHGWIPEGSKCFYCESADLRQQLQQAEKTIADMLMSTKPLEEYERIQRENKALRCCGNCKYEQWECDKKECRDNDFKFWVIAERLVK